MLSLSISNLCTVLFTLIHASPTPNSAQIRLSAVDHSDSAVQRSSGAAPLVADPSHLIFASFAGLMQQWPNTLYPNGHSLILGTIPTGTLLYHARKTPDLPPKIEWLALDAEMSFGIMSGRGGFTSLLTYSTVRPMRVLVLDGMSAALSDSGWLDSQSVLMFGNATGPPSPTPAPGEGGERRPGMGWAGSEYQRAQALCAMGDEWGFDGVVRMNTGFEVIYCDFGGEGLRTVSQLNITDPYSSPGFGFPAPPDSPAPDPRVEDLLLAGQHALLDFDDRPDGPDPNAPGGPGGSPPGGGRRPGNWTRRPGGGGPGRAQNTPFSGSSSFEWLRSASWHSPTKDDARVQLDASTFVSFYETEVRSLARKRVEDGTENQRRKQRLLGITNEEGEAITKKIKELVLEKNAHGWDERSASGVDWKALVATVVDRYEGRLDELAQLTGNASTAVNATTRAIAVRAATYGSLFAYIDMSNYSNTSLAWLDSAQARCESAFTSHINQTTLTPSEMLLRNAAESVLSRICSSKLSILSEALSIGLPIAEQTGSAHIEAVASARLAAWHTQITDLKEWLGWGAGGIKCDSVCGMDEVCSVPMWPLSMFGGGDGPGRGGGGDEQSATLVPTCVGRTTGGRGG